MKLFRVLLFVWNHPLNAGGRFSAVIRVLRWQLASRLMPVPMALPFVDNSLLFATRGMSGATGCWYCGLQELEEMAFVLHLLRPGDHFLDVGANIGSYTILAAATARVTAVEPVPSTFAHLERNITLNGFGDRVRSCRLGLSDRESSLRFTSDLDTTNHVLSDGENEPSVMVKVMPLDQLVGADTPLVMKIDVEGYEHAVLTGAKLTLGDPRLLAVILETNASGSRSGSPKTELSDLMHKHGFEPAGYDPFSRQIIPARDDSVNTIFVRNRQLIGERLTSARRFRLINGQI